LNFSFGTFFAEPRKGIFFFVKYKMEFLQSISGFFLEHKLTFLLQYLKFQKKFRTETQKSPSISNFPK